MYRLLLCVHRHEALLNFLYLKPTTLLLVIHFTCLQNCNVVLIFYLETDHVCGHFSDSWNTYFRNVSFLHAFFSHISVSFSTFSSFSCYLVRISSLLDFRVQKIVRRVVFSTGRRTLARFPSIASQMAYALSSAESIDIDLRFIVKHTF